MRICMWILGLTGLIGGYLITLVSNVCEAVPRPWFWAPNGLNRSAFTGSTLKDSYNPIKWQIDNGIFNRPVKAFVGNQNRDFGAGSQMD